MNIGELKLNGAGVYMGKIQTATLDLVVGLRPVNSSNAAAKYDVMVRAKNGQFIPVGGLWEKTANNGGGTFLQGQIDDPSFEARCRSRFSRRPMARSTSPGRVRVVRRAGFADTAVMGAANDGFGAGACSPHYRPWRSRAGSCQGGLTPTSQNACSYGRPVSRRVAYFRSMLGGIIEVRADQIDMADAQRQRQLVKRDDGRIAPSTLQTAGYCWLKPERSSTCS
jgi:uncharacterized protein (DUF736 family)